MFLVPVNLSKANCIWLLPVFRLSWANSLTLISFRQTEISREENLAPSEQFWPLLLPEDQTLNNLVVPIWRSAPDQDLTGVWLTCMAINMKSIRVPIPQKPTVQNFNKPARHTRGGPSLMIQNKRDLLEDLFNIRLLQINHGIYQVSINQFPMF